MQQTTIVVTALMRAKDMQSAQVQDALLGLVEPTRAEPGCIVYELYRSSDQEGCFMFYECWHSRQALEEHLRKPYIRDFMRQADTLLAEPVRVSVWEKITEAAKR